MASKQTVEKILSTFAVAVINMTDNPTQANDMRLKEAVKKLAEVLAK